MTVCKLKGNGNLGKLVRLSVKDYNRLKKISGHQDIPMAQLISKAIKSLEVKKVKNEKDVVVCDECGEGVPEDAVYCSYCGVEFEEDELELEDEEEEDEEEED